MLISNSYSSSNEYPFALTIKYVTFKLKVCCSFGNKLLCQNLWFSRSLKNSYFTEILKFQTTVIHRFNICYVKHNKFKLIKFLTFLHKI